MSRTFRPLAALAMFAVIVAGCSNGSAGNGNTGTTSKTRTASAVLIGAFAGLMPAVRASRMPPTMALRTL